MSVGVEPAPGYWTIFLRGDSLVWSPPGTTLLHQAVITECPLILCSSDFLKVSLLFFFLLVFTLTIQRRQWHPTPVLLPGKSHGRRSLVGCNPRGRQESDTTERLHFHFSLSCIGEGHGNPLQCSCLENPRDGGAWWLPSMGSHRVRHDWSDLA